MIHVLVFAVMATGALLNEPIPREEVLRVLSPPTAMVGKLHQMKTTRLELLSRLGPKGMLTPLVTPREYLIIKQMVEYLEPLANVASADLERMSRRIDRIIHYVAKNRVQELLLGECHRWVYERIETAFNAAIDDARTERMISRTDLYSQLLWSRLRRGCTV